MTSPTKELEAQEVEKKEVEVTTSSERTRSGKAFVPRVDIYETAEALVIVADMPGVDENSVDLTLEKNILSLKGYVKPANPTNYALVYTEYEDGDYERSFTLSDEIDREKIEASVKNGVVQLYLPKAGPAKTRKIAIKSA